MQNITKHGQYVIYFIRDYISMIKFNVHNISIYRRRDCSTDHEYTQQMFKVQYCIPWIE